MSATYGDLQSAIARELFNRTDLTTEIQAAIQSAIAHYQKHEFYFSEEQDTATTVNGQSSLGLPSDHGWVEGLTIIYSTYPIPMLRRDWLTMQQLYVNSSVLTGPPTDWAIFADQLWFWPTPNGAYTVTMWQNIQNAAPSADSDSNNWTVDAEELIRSRAVADVRCHVLRDPPALQEFGLLGPESPFFSKREHIAYTNLKTYTAQRIGAGVIKPIDF